MIPQKPTHVRERPCRQVTWKGKNCHDLPSLVDDRGVVSTEWVPTAEELTQLLRGAPIILWQHTGGHPLQPQSCSVGRVPGGED